MFLKYYEEGFNMNNILGTEISSANNVLISAKTASQAAKISEAENKAAERIKSSEKEARTDSYESSGNNKTDATGIYSRESLLEQLRNSEQQRVKAFEDTIRSMMAQQGQMINLTFRGVGLHVTEAQRAEAEKSVSEGGEYSVNAVSNRIMDMAKALAGEDSSKISILREAVQKGFGGAASLLGKNEDEMPDITKDTYKEIMKRFDDWENSFKKDESETQTDAGNQTETEGTEVS